jgi:ribose 5-phosphate isomerase B
MFRGTIYLAADHGGYALKEFLKAKLLATGAVVEDCGAFSFDKDDDYTTFVRVAAQKVAEDPASRRAVVLGGSGQGEAMLANRFKGVHASVFYGPRAPVEPIDRDGLTTDDPFAMLALTREHNDSNVLSLGGRFMTQEDAWRAVSRWLESPFSGAERHMRRLAALDE